MCVENENLCVCVAQNKYGKRNASPRLFIYLIYLIYDYIFESDLKKKQNRVIRKKLSAARVSDTDFYMKIVCLVR